MTFTMECSVTDTIGVVIPVYGDNYWYVDRSAKAFESVIGQTIQPDEIRLVYKRDGKLHEVLNDAISSMRTDFVCRLDADDQLSLDFIERFHEASGDIRKPYICPVDEEDRQLEERYMHPDGPILWGNHIVSTSPIRRKIFMKVGGYRDLPFLEDHDLFIRMIRAGAIIGHMDGTMFYTQHARSRNRLADHESHVAMIGMFRAIYSD